MIKESENKYIIWRMIPTGTYKYFFSIQYDKTSISYNQEFIENESEIVNLKLLKLIFVGSKK